MEVQSKKILKRFLVSMLGTVLALKTVSAAEITAIDFNGDLIGKVIPDGKVVSYENELIGNVTADSLIVNFEGSLIGGVVPQGIAIGVDNKLLGKVNNDGTVRSSSGKIIGKALPSGLVVDDYYKVIGGVLSPGLVYSDEGKTIGRLTGDGAYMNLEGEVAGFMTPDGYAYRRMGGEVSLEGKLISSKMIISPKGEFIGSMVPGGKITNFEGEEIGFIHANGIAYNEKSEVIGRAVKSGYAFGINGEYIGFVTYNGEVTNKGKVVGYLQLDGQIADKEGKIIGYSLDLAATLNDENGEYVGRLMPEGKIALSREIIGSIGARGTGVDKDNKVMGYINITGPIFDYKGTIKGISSRSGKAISLEGAPIGFVNFDTVYESNGRMLGKTLNYNQVYDLNNKPLGIAGIQGKIIDGEETKQTSPYGYVYNGDGTTGGRLLQNSFVFGQNGLNAAVISADGMLSQNGTKIEAHMTQSGVAVRTNGNILGGIISPKAALTFVGNSLGLLGGGNRILDTKNKILAKILPDNSVVSTDSESSTNFSPSVGQALKSNIALDLSGALLGYMNENGIIKDLSRAVIGRGTSDKTVVDNNGATIGGLVDNRTVVNDNCQTVGYVDTSGEVKNFRNVKLGRMLLNNQAVNDSGTYIGHNLTEGIVVGNNKVLGTITAEGKALDSENKLLGCVNKRGFLISQNQEVLGSRLEYGTVMNFNNKIIGRIILDGSIVNDKQQLIGRILPNGNAINDSNVGIGRAFRYRYAFSNSNKFLGRVAPDGNVMSSEGKSIGKTDVKGFVRDEKDTPIGYALYDLYVYDNNNNTKAVIGFDGSLKALDGTRIGKISKGFFVNGEGVVQARGNRDYFILDDSNNVLGELQMNGDFVSMQGEVLGHLGKDGNIFDSENKLIATANSLQYYSIEDGREKIYDANGNVIGYKEGNTVVDENNNIIGTIDENGLVYGTDGSILGGSGTNWYERIKPQKSQKDLPEVGEYKKKMKDDDIEYKKETLNSINIALSPDGTYLGDILEDGTVVDENGNIIGRVNSDGYVIDNNGDYIGTQTPKNMYVPKIPISPEAYISGDRRINIGPGGGTGPGERYDPQRAAALAAAQNLRRENIQVGHVASKVNPSSVDGYQKNWDEEGVTKAVSSWRVDLSEMIFSDKPIPAVIARSIDTNNPTPVTAIVERNVYAEEGRNVIIPAGSRIMGTINSMTGSTESTTTSARVQITWERLVRPDGVLFKFQGITGDAMGRGGALGYLDQQLFKKYTLPVMTTALTSYSAYLMAPKSNSSSETETPRQQAANDARDNFLEQMDQVFNEILQDKSNIQPLTYVPAGTRIIVYPNIDLWMRTPERSDEDSELNRRNILIDDKEVEAQAAKEDVSNRPTTGVSGSNNQALYQNNGEEAESKKFIDDSEMETSNKRSNINGSVPPPPSSTGLVPAVPMSNTSGPKPGINQDSGGTSNQTPETDDSVVKLI